MAFALKAVTDLTSASTSSAAMNCWIWSNVDAEAEREDDRDE